MSVCAVNWGMLAITLRRGTGKWVSVIRATRDRTFPLAKSASPACAMPCWTQIRPRHLIPSVGIMRQNSGQGQAAVYVTLHNSGEYELPIYYATFNGDLFNLPAGPVSFAIGGEYDAPRFTRDRDALNNTFNTIGSDGRAKLPCEPGHLGNLRGNTSAIYQSDMELLGLLQLRGGLCRARRMVQQQHLGGAAFRSCSRRSRRRTASIMRRSRRYRSAGNRWIRSTSAH